MEIHGTCKQGFEAVRDAFEQNFAEGLEVGAAAAVTVDGIRIMSEAGARKALEEQIDNVDDVLYMRLRHGIGFARDLEGWVSSPNANHMFWGGWGGSIALVDFDVRASVAYVMNRMEGTITGDPRGNRIVDSALASITAAG